jgi:enoyl-CoA hydratase
MSEHISIEQRGEIALVRVDRPPANAMDVQLLEESIAALDEVAALERRAVVITGREGFFSAGADLKVVPTLGPSDQRKMVDGINRMATGWYGLERPVVCAVNGHAIAGGMVLALCADYRVGSTEGKLGLTEVRAGVPYPAAAIAVVRAELSAQAARRLALGAGLVDPPEALKLGLVDELRPPSEVLDRALEVARELAALPAASYAHVKRQLRGELVAEAQRVIDEGSDPLLQSWTSGDTGDAAAAVLRGEA